MKRPLSITIIGWLFIVACAVGFVYHFQELSFRHPFSNDATAVLTVRLLGLLGGYLVLRGSNVGRWILLMWMAFHVGLSYFHPFGELIMHAAFFLVLVYFLIFRKKEDEYFSFHR